MELLRSAFRARILVTLSSRCPLSMSGVLKPIAIGLLGAIGGISFGVCINSCHAQTVQLPNHRHFSLRSSAQIPDGGSSHLGGIQRDGSYNSRTPAGITNSRTRGSSGTSVHATVIDLNELDRMIRCQSEEKPVKLRLPSYENSQSTQQGTVARNKIGCKEPPARYDYIMSMSHDAGSTRPETTKPSLEDARYYLQFADKATRRGEWSNAEFFYNLAWDNLPPERRTTALKELLEARAERIAANADRAHGGTSNKKPATY